MQTSALKLLAKDFKNGQSVIIITENERFDWGTLKYNKETVTLTSGLRPPRTYHWNQIVFMCHDGFPVRKVFGKFPEMERRFENVPGLFRAALAMENLEKLDSKAHAVRGLLGLAEVELEEVSPGFRQSPGGNE